MPILDRAPDGANGWARLHATYGVPSSGARQIERTYLLSWLTAADNLLSGEVVEIPNFIRVSVENAHVFVGPDAGNLTASGLNLTSLGDGSMKAVTSGNNAVAIGTDALKAMTTGNFNTLVGYRGGEAITTGTGNSGLGPMALLALVDGDYNVAAGYDALSACVSGDGNVAIGRAALDVYTGSDAVAVGPFALTVATGVRNSALGASAGGLITTGSRNTMVGYGAGANVGQKVDAVNSIAIGDNAITTLDHQVALGNSEILYVTAFGQHLFRAPASATQINLGEETTQELRFGGGVMIRSRPDFLSYFFGHGAGEGGPGGGGNIGLGYQSLFSLESGATNNVAVGYLAGHNLESGGGNVLIGDWAGHEAVTGLQDCTVVGSMALRHALAGVGTTAIGKFALGEALDGGNNTAVGDSALRQLTTGVGNVAIGYRSCDRDPPADEEADFFNADYCVVLGLGSGWDLHTGENNVGIGRSVFSDNAQANDVDDAIAIGALSYVTGDNAIAIGTGVSAAANQIVLGNSSHTHTALRGSVGIGLGVTTPGGALHVANSDGAATILLERSGQTTDAMHVVNRLLATKTSNMGDDFGVAMDFCIQDDAAVINTIGRMGAFRNGADNTGAMWMRPYSAGVATGGLTVYGAGPAWLAQSLSLPAGGSANARMLFTSGALGIYFGSGAPTIAAAKGSLYLRSDGSANNNRAYINTDGSTTWTALATQG